MTYYVYAHIKPDGTIFYIGKGKARRAWSTHSRNKHWHNIVNKYGRIVVILVDKLSETQAIQEEASIISHFKPFGYLVNILDRGDINPMSDPDVRKRHKVAMNRPEVLAKTKEATRKWFADPKNREEVSKRFKGVLKSEETKKKMGAWQHGENNNMYAKGHLISGEKHGNFKGAIEATNISTLQIKILVGKQAMRDAGFSTSKVYACVNGKIKSHKGHTFIRLTIPES